MSTGTEARTAPFSDYAVTRAQPQGTPATTRIGIASTICFTGCEGKVIHFAKSSVGRDNVTTDGLDRREGWTARAFVAIIPRKVAR
jgi:hypothetical protein